MKISIRQKENVVILDLYGNIDINASTLVEAVGKILDSKTFDIIFNLENVNLVDYVGISLIAVTYKNILNHRGRLLLCSVPSHIRKLFSIVGLDRVFYFYTDEDHALRGLEEERKMPLQKQRKLRRRFKRIPINVSLKYKPKLSSDSTFYNGKVVNLSGEGVFITSKRLFPVGEFLSVHLNLTPSLGTIEVDVRVAWIADRQIQEQDYPGMGLEFYQIDSETQEKIIKFVEKHITHSTP